jgi:hypothetical protein
MNNEPIAKCEHGAPDYINCTKCMEAKKKQTETVNKTPSGLEWTEIKKIPDFLTENTKLSGDYDELERVLKSAFGQAAFGKGKKRHGNGLTFTNQPIMQIARMVGIGGHSYQIMKKAQEATNMTLRGDHDAAIAEFYGVINYAAAAILLIEEKKEK